MKHELITYVLKLTHFSSVVLPPGQWCIIKISKLKTSLDKRRPPDRLCLERVWKSKNKDFPKTLFVRKSALKKKHQLTKDQFPAGMRKEI